MRKRLFSFLCAVLCCVLIVNNSPMPVGAWFWDEESFNGYLTFENIVEDETYPTGSYVYHCRVLYEDKTIFAHVDDIAVLTNSAVSKPTEISTLVQFDRNGYFVTVDLADGSTNLSTAYFPILNDLSLEHKETEDGDIYLPLEKMLYLMNATWSVSEDRVYICAPKDTLWSVASEYYRAAQNRPGNWMFLGTTLGDTFENSFKYGLLSMADEIDYKIFIPFLGPYLLNKQHVENILISLATDETTVLQNYTIESIDEFLSKYVNNSTKYLTYAHDLTASPSTISDIVEAFSDSSLFTSWDSLDDSFVPKLMAMEKELGRVMEVADVIELIVDISVPIWKAHQWEETHLEEMLSLSKADTSRYDDASFVKTVTAAAESVYNLVESPLEQTISETVDLIFDKAFGLTTAGKIVEIYNIIITSLSLYPGIKEALEVADAARDTDLYIDVGNIAMYHFADVLNSVIQKDIKTSDIHKAQNGNYSITPLDEIRYAYDLMLSSYLRSWDMLYQLSQTEEIYYDRGLVEIKNQALEIYTLIIRLNESARYDGALFIQKDFGNLYSEEVKEEENTEDSPSGLPEQNDVVREKIPSSLIIVRGPALTASQLTWLVEPTWDYQTVEPIPGPPVSDILGTPNYADGTTPFFQQDKTFPFVEMSFPLYSSLPEYYGVIEPDGEWEIFYIPERVDTAGIDAEIYAPNRYDSYGISVIIDIYYPGALSKPWHLLFQVARGGAHEHFVWDSDSRQFCFFGGGEGTAYFKKANLLGLHKPYPVTEVRLGNLVQELGDEYVGSSLDVNWDWEQINREDGFYAYAASDGTLLTDFVYRGVGDFSDGLAACSLDGKNWGYIDETGTPVTDFIYEPVWLTNQDSESYTSYWEKPQAYPCTDDTIVVRKDGKYGLLYRDGTTLIEFGELEAMAPSWNHQLWAKQDGLWGLIDLADAKEKAGIPVEEAEPAENDAGTLQSVWSSHLQSTGETEVAFLPTDYDGDGTEEAIGITGIFDGQMGYYDAKIYYISAKGEISCVRSTTKFGDSLYGYLNDRSGQPLLAASSQQFLVWEVSAYGSGSSSIIIGVRDGQAYEPDISEVYMNFGLDESGQFVGWTSGSTNGGRDYFAHPFIFDESSGQFIEN